MSSAAAVTDASFEQDVLKSDLPVLIDFWAPWCGPCRMVAPIVDEIATEFEGKIKVFKLNTDENPNVASQYGIRSIPTLMIFKGGQKVDTVVGAVPKTTLSSSVVKSCWQNWMNRSHWQRQKRLALFTRLCVVNV